MSVRAKLQLAETTEHAYGGKRYRFVANYDPSIPEDRRFARASPSGTFEILVDNPAVFDQFRTGDFYYVDFNPVPVLPE